MAAFPGRLLFALFMLPTALYAQGASADSSKTAYFATDIVAGLSAARVRLRFGSDSFDIRHAVMAQLGFRTCVTCRLRSTPVDLGAAVLVNITATGVRGITPGHEPFGFSQEGLLGVQLVPALRALPSIRPYTVVWLAGQYTAERTASARIQAQGDSILNYQQQLPHASALFGLEIQPPRFGGWFDLRATRVDGVFSHAERHGEPPMPVPPLSYSGWMYHIGLAGPFYGMWP